MVTEDQALFKIVNHLLMELEAVEAPILEYLKKVQEVEKASRAYGETTGIYGEEVLGLLAALQAVGGLRAWPRHEGERNPSGGLPVRSAMEDLVRQCRSDVGPQKGRSEGWVLERPNYPSAAEHSEHLRKHLDAEVSWRRCRMGVRGRVWEHRAIVALGVLVEDLATGKKRVIHDGMMARREWE